MPAAWVRLPVSCAVQGAGALLRLGASPEPIVEEEVVVNVTVTEPPWLPLQRAVQGMLRGLGGSG